MTAGLRFPLLSTILRSLGDTENCLFSVHQLLFVPFLLLCPKSYILIFLSDLGCCHCLHWLAAQSSLGAACSCHFISWLWRNCSPSPESLGSCSVSISIWHNCRSSLELSVGFLYIICYPHGFHSHMVMLKLCESFSREKLVVLIAIAQGACASDTKLCHFRLMPIWNPVTLSGDTDLEFFLWSLSWFRSYHCPLSPFLRKLLEKWALKATLMFLCHPQGRMSNSLEFQWLTPFLI